MTKVTEQHRWLHQLVGDWNVVGRFLHAAEGEGPAEWTMTERVRLLGELWAISEGSGDMPDGVEMNYLSAVGFDPDTGRFVGSFISSVNSFTWRYDGELSEDGKSLILSAEAPRMDGPGTAVYQDIITVINDEERLLTNKVQGADGEFNTFMQSTYRRAR